MPEPFTVSEASKLTGIAKATLRAYTQRYASLLSTEATPDHGGERYFTAADLRVLSFVFSLTSTGKSHEYVLQALSSGQLESYDWSVPENVLTGSHASESPGEALVPLANLQAAQAIMQDAQRREAAALEQVATLQEQVRELERELGKAQGEAATLKASRYRAPSWVRALFGGREG